MTKDIEKVAGALFFQLHIGASVPPYDAETASEYAGLARAAISALLPPSAAMVEAAAKAIHVASGGKLTDTCGAASPGKSEFPADDVFLTFGKSGIEPRVAHFAWRLRAPEARAALTAAINQALNGARDE